MKFSDVMDGYRNYCNKEYSKPVTDRFIKLIMEMFEEVLENVDLNEEFTLLGKEQIEEYVKFGRSSLAEYFLKKKTVMHFLKYVSTFMTIPKVNLNRPIETEFNILTEEEVNDILEEADTTTKCIILLAYEQFFRSNEMVNLKITDIDFINKKIKNVDMSDLLAKVLRTQINELYENIDKWNYNRKLKGQPFREDSDYVFQSRQSVMVTPKFFARRIASLCKNVNKYFVIDDIRISRKACLLQDYSIIDLVRMDRGDLKYYYALKRYVETSKE